MSGVVKRLVWVLVFAGAVAFALQGGEYSTADLWRQFTHKRALTRNVDSLGTLVDSLARFSKLVQTDSATQERIAREEFGMVRGDKEILYRFGDPDSARSK